MSARSFLTAPPTAHDSRKLVSQLVLGRRRGAACTPAQIQDHRVRMTERSQTLQVRVCPSCTKQPRSPPAPHMQS